jgi:hypothetical protein
MSETALYAYAVLPEAAEVPPDAPPILPDAPLSLVGVPGCAALVARVPRAPFVAGPECRTADPDWLALRARAHHDAIAAAARRGPVLPMAFGALFSGPGPLTDWLHTRAARLVAALSAVAGCAEVTVRVEEQPEAHIAWLDQHDQTLRALAARVERAPPGTAFLLGQSRARQLQAARQTRHHEASRLLAARLEAHARALPGAMTALVAEADMPRLRADLAAVDRELAGTGLALRLAGPWPPYAFARAALSDG